MIRNNDILIIGDFKYPNGENKNVPISEDGDSTIEFIISSSDIGYSAESGTADIDVLKR